MRQRDLRILSLEDELGRTKEELSRLMEEMETESGRAVLAQKESPATTARQRRLPLTPTH